MMTAEEVKQQLGQYLKICAECDSLWKRIENQREAMNYPRAVVADGIPCGGVNNSVERDIERIDELTRCYEKMCDDCERVELHVQELINLAPAGNYRNILEMHYIDGVAFEDIPKILFVSRSTVYNYKNIAIEKICTQLD